MLILDTNVVSELMKDTPNRLVVEYLDNQIIENIYLTSITVAELLRGIKQLPISKKQNKLFNAFNQVFGLFENRVLPFDVEAGMSYADLMVISKNNGCNVHIADAFIASIASIYNFAIVTRDVRPFELLGLEIINPWNANHERN